MSFATDVLVVGAGPIGLINAWGIKELNPRLNIVVLEKYAEYQRSHNLILHAHQLEAIMKATHSENHPTLKALLARLRNDPHIRTNELQQIFSNLAQENGVEILTQQEVKKEEMPQVLEDYPNVKLIIGADGTHSVVSQALFSEENQIKHEFDFVLQLRYEINGEEKAPGLSTQRFFQQMARKGLIASEYVGHFDEGKTPVTMQMMISKEDFLLLKSATSKNPLMPFAENVSDKEEHQLELPRPLMAFITTYLEYKISDTLKAGQQLDRETVRVSVNEAPATHANQVVNKIDGDKTRVILMGDAALGLSYFKGLNAGLEASGIFLTTLSAAIENGFQNTKKTDECLENYQSWFLNDFAPKKVKEVGQYSYWQIRCFMETMKVVRSIKNASALDYDEDLEPAIRDYFNHYAEDPNQDAEWVPFPHREYDLVRFGQWDYVPLQYTLERIGKIFADYVKPYKGSYQLIEDFKQPLAGIGNFLIGFLKFIVGIFTLNSKTLADGLMSMLRGAIELVTFPFALVIKPMTRSLATGINGDFNNIEKNRGIRTLAEYGYHYLEAINHDEQLADSKTQYEILPVCNDLHRKFDKQMMRGQKSAISQMEEYSRFSALRADKILHRDKLINYFSLFAPPKTEEQKQEEDYVIERINGNSLNS